MSIDLHCHTRYSDGSTPLEELIQLATLRGVTTFALTDHDTMAGCECALELGREAGVTVIPGVEISAVDPKRHGKAHILCYKPKLYDSKTGIAYEKVDYPDIDTVMDAVDAAEGIAVLAHPSEYHSMDLLRELCRNHRIRGIEVYHPRNTEEDKAEILRLAEKYDLAVTGGTDYHGFYTTKKNPVGTFTTAESEFDKLFSE